MAQRRGFSAFPRGAAGFLCAALCAAVGCAEKVQDTSGIEWAEAKRSNAIIAPGAQLTIGDGGAAGIGLAWTPLRWPDDSTACAGTQVGARARGDTSYAVWWRRNSYGHGDLMISRSDNGVKWTEPTLIGGAVPASNICSRPPPALGVDLGTGAAYVAWHGMTNLGPGMLVMQAPTQGKAGSVAVRLDQGASVRMASVAASHDTVAIAFESETTAGSEIRLALSVTRGHIPDIRGAVSPSGVRAFAPLVALRDGRVAVAWNEGRRANAPPGAAARVGTILR
jgi:hypothetical protein